MAKLPQRGNPSVFTPFHHWIDTAAIAWSAIALRAWSSISHVRLVVLGLATFNIQGIQGAWYQLLIFPGFQAACS